MVFWFFLTFFSEMGRVICQDARAGWKRERIWMDLGLSYPKADTLSCLSLCFWHFTSLLGLLPLKRKSKAQTEGTQVETPPRKWALPEQNCHGDRPRKQQPPTVNYGAVSHLEIGSLLSTQPHTQTITPSPRRPQNKGREIEMDRPEYK